MLNATVNEAQSKAITHGEGPMLVLAGPGSGKTLVITQRIKYLIEEKQVKPEHILVITFTKAAALEMQKRFLSILIIMPYSSFVKRVFNSEYTFFRPIRCTGVPSWGDDNHGRA